LGGADLHILGKRALTMRRVALIISIVVELSKGWTGGGPVSREGAVLLEMSPVDCLVCRKHRGLEPPPGGPIYEDALIFSSHAALFGGETSHYLGHLFIETKRHTPGLADLPPEEGQAIAIHATYLARALMETLGQVHIYAFVIGDRVPHFHLHLIGRYPEAPREFWGPRVDEWPGAPKGTLAEISLVTERIRESYNARFAKA
jgi:diadenosine tetraphosphate (Ap4A) HIT family hydrolase